MRLSNQEIQILKTKIGEPKIKKRMARISDNLFYLIYGLKHNENCTYVEMCERLYRYLVHINEEFAVAHAKGVALERTIAEQPLHRLSKALIRSLIIDFDKYMGDKNE